MRENPGMSLLRSLTKFSDEITKKEDIFELTIRNNKYKIIKRKKKQERYIVIDKKTKEERRFNRKEEVVRHLKPKTDELIENEIMLLRLQSHKGINKYNIYCYHKWQAETLCFEIPIRLKWNAKWHYVEKDDCYLVECEK